MISLRRWLYRPKRSDSSLLAQFYFADEELNQVASELDSFEGRKDPERCTALVNQLRACQARVLNVVSQMMDETVKDQRTPRDFRVKFPDDVIQENLAGQLWFGAECLAAGSSIMNRETESASMRPLARALTKNLDSLRTILRDQCLRNIHEYSEIIRESLIIFDKLFAEFELRYVSAMVPVKTAHEYDMIQEITVLFSETVQRALKVGLLTRDMIDEYDPALMFTIPRLAIVSGVLVFKDGPLNPDNDPWNISDMFRPFQTLLLKIRELLSILTEEELNILERALCSQEEPSYLISLEEKKKLSAREERRKSREEKKVKGVMAKKKKKDESDDGSVESELTALEIAERLEALALSFEASRNAKQTQTNEQQDPETQSKISETSSSSSASLLSDADCEEMGNAEAAKESESGSDDCGDVQLQRFTNQLYYEANLDSHTLAQGVSILGPANAFNAEEVFTNPPAVSSDCDRDADDAGSKAESAEPQPSGAQEDGVESPDTETATAGRAHFAMNKCDSSDSGLHSEVLSNSGSLFTISSSDSNQHLGNPDIPVTSESISDHNEQSLSNSTCVQPLSYVDVTCVSQTVRENESVQIDSRDSSNTLIPEPEPNCDDKKCLDSLSSCEKECQERSSNSVKEDDVMASDEENNTADSSKNSPSPSPAGHTTAVEERDPTASGICPDISSCKHAQDCMTHPLTHTNNKFEDTRGEFSVTGSEVAGEMKDVSSEHSLEEQSVTNVFQICGHSNIENGDIQANKVAQHPESSGVVPTSGDDLPLVHNLVCDNIVDKKIGDSHTQVDDNHVSNQEQTALFTESSVVDSHTETKIVPTSPTTSEENKECKDDKENNESCHQNETTTLCHAPCDNASSETDLAVKSELSVSGDSSVALTAPAQTQESPPVETLAMPCSPSHATSTSEQTDSQGKQNNPPTTTTQNELLHNSSAASTSSSSPTIPSASTSKSNHKGAKGSSKAKERSKKSSKTSATDSRRRPPRESRSSLPGQAKSLMESHLLDTECYHSSETSSYTSDCADQEEIALAIKAAESATRHQVRARFRSSSDMIHRLFVCISGVADQLQTNFAGDLRNILRAVFDMNCSEPMDISEGDKCKDTTPLGAAYRAMSQASRNARRSRTSANQRQEPPTWIPDEQSNECMSCQVPFTFVRRRHHCRNCGKIFCSRCSSNFVPLPHFGQERAVRVCNRCFMFRVTPFTVQPSTSQ